MNVLTWPGIGRFLRWRWGRLSLQLGLGLLATLVVYDGFTGDALAARNLATVSIWVHFRGLVVLALLLVGNLFCMACPFPWVRSFAHGRGFGRLRWPMRLRNKYVALLALFALLYAYEALDLWRSPWLTAWLTVAYFAVAFAAELLFEGSPFCKYVCPLGTFNTLYSNASPLRIQALDPNRCLTCVGKECLNGSSTVAGCGTSLFVPQMQTQVDCLLCLDCVRACPHDNVGLLIGRPGRALTSGGWRERPDLGLLVMSLCFLALANAFGMTPPIYTLLRQVNGWLRLEDAAGGNPSEGGLGLLLVFGGLGVGLPGLLGLLAASLTRRWTRTSGAEGLRAGEPPSLGRLIGRFSPAFLPLGLAIWTVHYQFHFLTGALAIIPVTHGVLIDHGWMTGRPDFSLAELVRPSALHPVEVLGVALGFLASFGVLWSIGLRHYGSRNRALWAILPWALMLIGVTVAAIRVFGYPMEMRGIATG